MTGTEQAISDLFAKANEKLRSAKLLYDNSLWEDAASRAYYTAFLSVSAVLLSRDLTYSSHRQTIGAFNKEHVKPGDFPSTYGRRLNKMREDREAGDYRTDCDIGEMIAKEDIEFAEEVMDKCKKFLSVD